MSHRFLPVIESMPETFGAVFDKSRSAAAEIAVAIPCSVSGIRQLYSLALDAWIWNVEFTWIDELIPDTTKQLAKFAYHGQEIDRDDLIDMIKNSINMKRSSEKIPSPFCYTSHAEQ